MPRLAELDDPAGLADPLDEVAHSPVKNVVRVYPDRIAFCVNNECALYCRYCLRKRMVGDEDWAMRKRELAEAIAWIRRTPEIRDVLLTGGDPLVFPDERLDWLIGELRTIPHVEIVRLGTRLPVTLPFRVTDDLCRLLAAHHPVWLNTHFNHPKELTPDAVDACDRLTRAGIPVGNQSVLLRGHQRRRGHHAGALRGPRARPGCARTTSTRPSSWRARPTSGSPWSAGSRSSGRCAGAPAASPSRSTCSTRPYGKVPLDHPYYRGREGDEIVVEAWDGRVWREPNPGD